jgi:hypothetical protein
MKNWLIIGLLLMILRERQQPRGLRNNNPLNIRATTDNWRGKVGADDAGFVVFDDVHNGLRAGVIILKNYREKYGLNTISAIISRWAPSNENDTQSYIDSVARQTGINANQALDVSDYPAVIAAMIRHENGKNPFNIAEITQSTRDYIA